MNRGKFIHRFEFKYQAIANREIGPPFANFHAFIINRKNGLANERYIPQGKLHTKGIFTNRFQKTWSKMFVNLNGGANDLIRELI